jgi:hypothetical protein
MLLSEHIVTAVQGKKQFLLFALAAQRHSEKRSELLIC